MRLPPPRPGRPATHPDRIPTPRLTPPHPRPAGQRVAVAASHGGLRDLGYEYAIFPNWYGPGTSLRSYRFSYFLVIVPAAVLPWPRSPTSPSAATAPADTAPAIAVRAATTSAPTPDQCPACGARRA